MNKKNVVKYVRGLIKLILIALPIDALFHAAQKLTATLAKASRYREWGLAGEKLPQFYRHELNLYQWRFQPKLWEFCARGVHARMFMKPGCKVLDLCSGDGSYGYLFYSDIAERIDAVDADPSAIQSGQKYFGRNNIRYFQLNLITAALPADDYDVVVFNSGMYYFSEQDVENLLRKMIVSNKRMFSLIGNVPKANGHRDHKFEFEDKKQIENLLGKFFEDIQVKEVFGSGSISFHFCASNPAV